MSSPDPEIEALLAMDLPAGEDDWTPTPHGLWLSQVLASRRGRDLLAGKDVLELGAGVANHSIVLLRQGVSSLVATEINEDLLATTRRNLERNIEGGDLSNVELRVADWLDTGGRFDLIVTNPPFCKSGKQNRRYFIDSLIIDAHKRLNERGEIIFVQSTMADLGLSKRTMERCGFDVQELGRTKGPFRDYYFEDETFMEEIRRVPDGFEVRGDGEHIETLVVLHGKLRPYKPPPGAHVFV